MSSERTGADYYRVFYPSFIRCHNHQRFYTTLLKEYNGSSNSFLGNASEYSDEQCLMFLEILTSCFLHANYSSLQLAEAKKLARVCSNLNITVDHRVQQEWLEALITTVRHYDLHCNDLILAAWRRHFNAGAELFRALQDQKSCTRPVTKQSPQARRLLLAYP